MENMPKKMGRREFVKKITAATVGVILAPALSGKETIAQEKEQEKNITNEKIIEELFKENEIIPNLGKNFSEKVEIWYKRYSGQDSAFDEENIKNKEKRNLPGTTIQQELLEGWQRLLKGDLKIVSEIIKKNKLPLGILFLALAESHWKIKAVSKHGAKGPWQFMPKTARMYGLKVNKKIDERLDVRKSTEAACEYLKELYSYTETYELPAEDRWIWAFWAYNHGEGNIFGNNTRDGEFKETWMDPDRYFTVCKNQEAKNYPPRIFGLAQALEEMVAKGELPSDN